LTKKCANNVTCSHIFQLSVVLTREFFSCTSIIFGERYDVLTLTLYSTMVTKCIVFFKHSTTNAVHNKDQPVNAVGE